MTKNNYKSTVKTASYNIVIGQDIFGELSSFILKNKYSSVFVLTDKTLYKLYGAKLKKTLPRAKFITVPAGEKYKNLKTLEYIWQQLFRYGADRHSLLINFGGGVIGDMGGFAAGVYMRGMNFAQVPTTLLAQVDASVGGKTAVDLNNAKNIIGAFVRPALVLIDVDTLKTLPYRELLSGYAEVIKHGLIKDKKYFNEVNKKDLKKLTPKELAEIIKKSCQIKYSFVEQDEHEKGPRKILNFGHTIGHAVESLSFKTKHPLLHGEAVALGMISAAKLSVLKGLIKEEDFILIKESLEKHGFALKYPYAKKAEILKLILKDKKNKGKVVKWTLLNSIGGAVYDVECTQAQISVAADEIL
ncbi:3-dehydroquinate synthase [Elusimicrobium posterum]|uniref:3-dehydroquinate synthase n=1 Tax=Elusimicrobium posterum TaxID=3116653 RepID=UPI003C71893B